MKTILTATGMVDGQKVWFECRVTDKGLEWFTADKLKRWVSAGIEPQRDQLDAECALLVTFPKDRYQLRGNWIG